MKEVHRSALMPYTAQQMFDIVNDVRAYPEYLPWCRSSEILEESDDFMVARLDIAKGGLHQSFSTRNELKPPERIRIFLEEGPFTALEGDWRFLALGDDGCRVDMKLSFSMDGRLMKAVLGKVFSAAADTLVDAFCERAHRVYGSSHSC